MNKMIIDYRPIGIIHSTHTNPEKTPIQPVYARDCVGKVEIDIQYLPGLKDIDGFSYIYLLYHLHRVHSVKLTVVPFLDTVERGVFATRAPSRPNPIGLSLVELLRREDNILHVRGVDILDGTPLLDIKPYSSRFEGIESKRNGWQDAIDQSTAEERGRRKFKS
ncbi:tRNA (N6-threonylcarbamoyladenosine(37)-N6)-methyltransferase TrmO [bacterium]|nr:tRNA (N6-threonylcarbamoyladenosine(37)-N6)-methyltransferase TrmO [bacterium]